MALSPLEEALKKSERWMVECNSLLKGTSFPPTDRNWVAITLQHLSIEHHQGVHVLLDRNVVGSALALLRPQLEAYIRGVWFHYCATDKQVRDFKRGKGRLPEFGQLIEAIEKIDGYDCGTLSAFKKDVYGVFNDFTHGGSIQVRARISGGEVVSSYLPEHVLGALSESMKLSMLAAVAAAIATGETILANNLLETYLRIQEET